MRRFATRSISKAAISLAALAICQTAYAQDGGQEGANDDADSNVIIVTARKKNESLNDVPMSITAVSGEILANRGITDVEDLAKITPGLASQPGPYGNQTFNLRGIGNIDDSFASSATVALYIDQAPIPFSVMGQGLAFDVERVEVLKGPQGTLFGSNSTGGAINFIANKPGDVFEGGIKASINNFGGVEASGFLSAPLGDTLGVRVAGLTQQGGAWQRSVSRPGDELGDKDFFAGRFILDWEPSDSARVTLNLNGWSNNNDTQASQFVRFAPAVPPLGPLFAPIYAGFTPPGDNARDADWTDTPLKHDDRYYQATLNAEFDISDNVTLNSISAYSDYKQFIIIDVDGTPFNTITQRQGGSIQSFSQELRLSGEIGDRVSWMVGGSYGEDDVDMNALASLNGTNSFFPIFMTPPPAANSVATFDPTQASVDGRNSQDVETWGIFGSLDMEVTDTFTLSGSARYTETTNDYAGCFADPGNGAFATAINQSAPPGLFNALPGGCVTVLPGFPPTLGLVNDQLKEDNVSFRIGANWQPNQDTLVYANVTRGFKSGSYPNVPALFANQITPSPQEQLTAYELGLKQTFADGRIQFDAAAFYYDYKDKQLIGRVNVGPPIGFLPAAVSAPEAEVYGLEVNFSANPADGLTLAVGGSYVDAEVISSQINGPNGLNDAFDVFGNVVDLAGTRFPTTAKLTMTGSIDYEFDVSDSAEAYVGTSFNLRSKTNAQIAGNPEFEIDGYVVFDARAGIKLDNGLSLEIWGKNILDEFYLTTIINQVDSLSRRTGRPATYGATIGFEF